MPEIVCNTTPLQYLHQAGVLHILPTLYGRILVPRAVADEIGVGMKACCLPWIASRMQGSGWQRIHGATSLNWRENCDRDEGAQMALILIGVIFKISDLPFSQEPPSLSCVSCDSWFIILQPARN